MNLMATLPNPASPGGAAVAPQPQGGPIRPLRQPLGLPAGSVRALLTLMVLGIIWTLMLLPEDKHVKIPLYLLYLMFLILGHYFAAHGHTIRGPKTGSASPLRLPRGSIRALIFLGFLGVVGYRYYLHRDFEHLFDFDLEEPLVEHPYLPFILIGAFFLGLFMSRVVGRPLSGPDRSPPPWFQDFQAWIALLATIGLVLVILALFVINPGLAKENRLDWPPLQNTLAAIISFYFGMRS
jgi:hypothetical protein